MCSARPFLFCSMLHIWISVLLELLCYSFYITVRILFYYRKICICGVSKNVFCIRMGRDFVLYFFETPHQVSFSMFSHVQFLAIVTVLYKPGVPTLWEIVFKQKGSSGVRQNVPMIVWFFEVLHMYIYVYEFVHACRFYLIIYSDRRHRP